jgi:two-component sensor histidine kinase
MDSSDQLCLSRDELMALHERFREVKHAVNNTLAVIMALAELAKRSSQHYEKLADTVLKRCPDIVTLQQDFQKELGKKLKASEPGVVG